MRTKREKGARLGRFVLSRRLRGYMWRDCGGKELSPISSRNRKQVKRRSEGSGGLRGKDWGCRGHNGILQKFENEQTKRENRRRRS